MSRTFATGIVVSAGLSLSVALLAQSQPEKPLSFEVASIHENMYGESRWFWTSPALASRGEASIVNAPLRGIIAQAYDINPLNERFTLVGGPDDILSKHFDIRAKPAREATRAEGLLMLRTLLAERFGLRIHTENRPTPVHALTVARPGRLGPDIRPATRDCATFRKERQENPSAEEPRDAYGAPACMRSYDFGETMKMRDVGSIETIVARVQAFVDRPVVNQTGLTGTFDWVVSFSRNSNEPDGTTVFQAVQDRLGLKLENRTDSREALVIDHVERPTANETNQHLNPPAY